MVNSPSRRPYFFGWHCFFCRFPTLFGWRNLLGQRVPCRSRPINVDRACAFSSRRFARRLFTAFKDQTATVLVEESNIAIEHLGGGLKHIYFYPRRTDTSWLITNCSSNELQPPTRTSVVLKFTRFVPNVGFVKQEYYLARWNDWYDIISVWIWHYTCFTFLF